MAKTKLKGYAILYQTHSKGKSASFYGIFKTEKEAEIIINRHMKEYNTSREQYKILKELPNG